MGTEYASVKGQPASSGSAREQRTRASGGGPTREMQLVQRVAGSGLSLQRSGEDAAADRIGRYESLASLDETALGRELLRLSLKGAYPTVHETLDRLGSTDRDDVSLAFMQACSAQELAVLSGTDEGSRLIGRLFDELTSGSADEEEKAQADRIVKVKMAALDPAELGRTDLKIFPFRLSGLTVLRAAPLHAERRPGGKVWVKMPVHVLGKRKFREETRTLPAAVFGGGMELPENEIVGVRMYDQGETAPIVYRPALFLVQLANETTTNAYQKMGETAGIGLTLGGGQLAALGAEAGWAARAFLWADRIAFVVGTFSSIVQEHRGWLIDSFGENGRRFVDISDRVNAVIAIYGLTRGSIGVLKQLSVPLKAAHGRLLVSADAAEMMGEEIGTLQKISLKTEELLQKINNLYDDWITALDKMKEKAKDSAKGLIPHAETTANLPMPIPETADAGKLAHEMRSAGRDRGWRVLGDEHRYVRTGARVDPKKFEPFVRGSLKDRYLGARIQNVQGQRLPVMIDTMEGYFNNSGNGIDILAVDLNGNLWVVEVSAAQNKVLSPVRYASGQQMTATWRDSAAQRYLNERPEARNLIRKLFGWGKDLPDKEVETLFMHKVKNCNYAFVVPEGSNVKPASATGFIGDDVYYYHFENDDLSPLSFDF